VTSVPDRAWLAGALLVVLAWTVVLAGPGLFGAHDLPAGAFHTGHAFFAWHLGTVPAGGDLSHPPFGWPGSPSVQLIGWVPLAVGAVAQGLGPLRAYSVALVVGPLLTALATWGWLGRLDRTPGPARALGVVAFCTCSFAVAALGNGQLAKLQLWVLPAALWGVAALREAPSVGRALVLLTMVVAGVFSAPSLAVQLPVAAVAQVLVRDPGLRPLVPKKLSTAVGALAIVAVGLLPGALFMAGADDAGTRPAVAGTGTRVGGAAPSASLDDLLLGLGARADGLDAVNHAPVVGGLALVVALVMARRAGPKRRTGLVLLLVGAVLALGPMLTWGTEPVTVGGWTIALPAAVLTALHYPMGETGQWYRFVVVASLGLAALLARARSPRALGVVGVAVVLGALQAVHQSGHPFPRDAVLVPAAASMARLRTGGPPGAVVVLPLIASTVDGGPGLAMGALSGRHTSAMARHTEGHPATVELRAVLQRVHAARTPEAAKRLLAEAGVAVVVWRPGATVMRGEVWLDVAAVEADLGPPQLDGEAAVWWTDG